MKKSFKIVLFVVIITIIIIVNFNTTLNLSDANKKENITNNKHSSRNKGKAQFDENSGELVNPIDREIIDNVPSNSGGARPTPVDRNRINAQPTRTPSTPDPVRTSTPLPSKRKDETINQGVDEFESDLEDFDDKEHSSGENTIIILDEPIDDGKNQPMIVFDVPSEDWIAWRVIENSTDSLEVVKKCHYSNARDYNKQPMHVRTDRWSDNNKKVGYCDIPCEISDHDYNDASVYQMDQCTKTVYTTLENQPAWSKYDITSTTSLKSDVPIGYYSWHEYPYSRPAKPKIHDDQQGLVAAFISNCGPKKRLDWLKGMQDYGVKIDSFGRCAHNKEIPRNKDLPHDYNGEKMEIASTYKFLMAFENSETDDYVTEKLFGGLTVGTVPIYYGAPNARDFFPTPNAAILASDFETPQDLAKHLLYLHNNDTAYQEYLAWKQTGPTEQWMALIDHSLYSQECRACVRTADLHRKEVGRVLGDKERIEKMNKVPVTFTKDQGIVIYVREKHHFWFYAVPVPRGTTYNAFKKLLSKIVPHKGDLFQAYDLNSKELIISKSFSEKQIIHLKQEQEIELVFVDKSFFWDSFDKVKTLNQ